MLHEVVVMDESHHFSTAGTISNAAITAFVAIVPDEALSFLQKMLSVFILAVVAELGRRSINRLLKSKDNKEGSK